VETRLVRTNLPPRTIMRGPGTMQAVLLVEHIVDRIAAHLDADPVLVRERNLLTKPRAEGARPRGCPLCTPPAPPHTSVRTRAARRARVARAAAGMCVEELWLVAACPGVQAPACAAGVAGLLRRRLLVRVGASGALSTGSLQRCMWRSAPRSARVTLPCPCAAVVRRPCAGTPAFPLATNENTMHHAYHEHPKPAHEAANGGAHGAANGTANGAANGAANGVAGEFPTPSGAKHDVSEEVVPTALQSEIPLDQFTVPRLWYELKVRGPPDRALSCPVHRRLCADLAQRALMCAMSCELGVRPRASRAERPGRRSAAARCLWPARADAARARAARTPASTRRAWRRWRRSTATTSGASAASP